jgi:hypothetical protein
VKKKGIFVEGRFASRALALPCSVSLFPALFLGWLLPPSNNLGPPLARFTFSHNLLATFTLSHSLLTSHSLSPSLQLRLFRARFPFPLVPIFNTASPKKQLPLRQRRACPSAQYFLVRPLGSLEFLIASNPAHAHAHKQTKASDCSKPRLSSRSRSLAVIYIPDDLEFLTRHDRISILVYCPAPAIGTVTSFFFFPFAQSQIATSSIRTRKHIHSYIHTHTHTHTQNLLV